MRLTLSFFQDLLEVHPEEELLQFLTNLLTTIYQSRSNNLLD